ncbi:MAG: ABC transporter permease [Coriobacteriia bacterium]|nr:ABC transporter permease [Coriobacteriia bacterium]
MSNTKRFLSPGLYKEGLRRLRPAGILFGILGIGFPLVELVMTAVSAIAKTGNPKMAMSDLTSLAQVVLVVAAIFALASVFYLFNFLNKRGSSDFYHALPVSRTTLYFSFLAAILTWVWGVGFLGLLLVVAVALIGSTPLTVAMIAVSLGMLLSATLFVVAAALMAASITGTRFMNLFVLVLIMIIPNAIASAFTQAVVGRVPSLPVEFVGAIGSVSLHNTLFMLASDMSLYGAATFAASIAMTVLWSFVLIGAGAWFFKRRLSELAGTITFSRGFLLVFRVALAILVVAFGTVPLAGGSGTNGLVVFLPNSFSHPTSFVTLLRYSIPLLIFILVIFLGFELLVTRKLKSMWRTLPSFGLVLIFTLAFFGAIFLYSASAQRFTPTADQIASVQMITSSYGVVSSSSSPIFSTLFSSTNTPASFNDILTRNITDNDSVLLQATATKLREPFSAEDSVNSNGDPAARLIVVRMKDGSMAHRLIAIRGGSNPDTFEQALLKSPEIASALLRLPKPDAQMRFAGSAFPLSTGSLSITNFVSATPQQYFVGAAQQQRAYRALYGLFYAEYQKLNSKEQYQVLYGDLSQGQVTVSSETTAVADFVGKGTVQVEGALGAQQFSNTYNFNTSKALLQYWAMNCLDMTTASTRAPSRVHLDELKLFTSSAARGVSSDTTSTASSDPFWAVKSARFVAAVRSGGSTITITEADGSSSTTSIDDDPTETEISNTLMQRAETIIKPALSRKFNLDAPVFASLSVNYYEENNRNQLSQATVIVPLTAQEVAALQALTKK